jgi:ABC-2 type transport system ATP-binding protein
MGLMHSPELLFLDEPSTGLDPHNRASLLEHIRKLRAERGTTIVMTTHYLDEADSMAERVIVVDHGRVIADDTPDRLKADVAGDLVSLTFPDERTASRAAARVKRSERWGRRTQAAVEHAARAVHIRVPDGPGRLPGLLAELAKVGLTVASAEVGRPTLDDVFLNLTGRSLREGTLTTKEMAA